VEKDKHNEVGRNWRARDAEQPYEFALGCTWEHPCANIHVYGWQHALAQATK